MRPRTRIHSNPALGQMTMTDLVIISEAADGRGGASLAAINSAAAMASLGLRVHFFAATGPVASKLQGNKAIRVSALGDEYDLMQASPLVRARQSLWNSSAEATFRAFVRDLPVGKTLVHVHSFAIQLTASVVAASFALGFPTVFTAHDYAVACPYSGFYNYNSGAPCGKVALSLGCVATLCNESKSIPGKLWHVTKEVVQRSRGKVPSDFDHLIFPSEFSRDVLRPYLPSKMPTTVVRNVIDVPSSPPRELASDAPFIFVGRMTREKGPVLAARAAASIDAPIAFVGAGPEEEEVRKANPAAQLLGWLEPEEVRRAMRNARALVFPSRLFETAPSLVLGEAQALGLPAIVSDVSASALGVQHGVNGLHFQSGDELSLASQMRHLSDNPEAIRMSRAAHEIFWQDPATPEKHADATIRVYEDVWNRRQA